MLAVYREQGDIILFCVKRSIEGITASCPTRITHLFESECIITIYIIKVTETYPLHQHSVT